MSLRISIKILLVSALFSVAWGCSDVNEKNNVTNNGDVNNGQTNNGNSNNGSTNNGSSNNGQTTGQSNNGTTGGSNNGTIVSIGLSDPTEVFDFELDVPFAIPLDLGPESEFWRRPLGEDCPATSLTPVNKAAVPGVAIAYRNASADTISVTIEMISEVGDSGEAALDDPFIVVYSGDKIPTDLTQCLAANDTIFEAFDTMDAELEILVEAGEVITIVGTTFTYAVAQDVGVGHALLIATPTAL